MTLATSSHTTDTTNTSTRSTSAIVSCSSADLSVSFDESKNEVQFFERIPSHEKSIFWFPKSHFALNRKRQLHEQYFREQTKQLVFAKYLYLLHQTQLIPPTLLSEPKRLVRYHHHVEHAIMNRSKPDILAYLQSTHFHWINDSSDPWDELPSIIQQAATILGYSPSLWDDSLTTPISAFKNAVMATPSALPIPPLFHEPWSYLTAAQQQAAHTLGYTHHLWDDAFLDDDHARSDDEEDQENEQDDDERDDSPGNNGNRNHQGEVRRPLQSPSDDVHTNSSMKDVMYNWDTGPSFDDTAPDHTYNYRKEAEDETMVDVIHDINLEHEYDWIKTLPTKSANERSKMFVANTHDNEYKDGIDEDEFIANFLSADIIEPILTPGSNPCGQSTTVPTKMVVESNNTKAYKDGIVDDEFIVTFSSVESIEPTATVSSTLSSRREVDGGICNNDGVSIHEFIPNSLSEGTGMSTHPTHTGGEIPSENLVFEDDVDEEEFINNFLSVETHAMEPIADNIHCGTSDQSEDNIDLNVNLNDKNDDVKNDETIETTSTSLFAVTLDHHKEHRANIESSNSQLQGAPDTRSTRSKSTGTLSTGQHCLTYLWDDVEAHESSPLLQGQPGVDMETSTSSTPDADAPMGANGASCGGQQLLIRRILLGSKSAANRVKVDPQASLSRRVKNFDKIEGDKPPAYLPYRSLVGVLFVAVCVWLFVSP